MSDDELRITRLIDPPGIRIEGELDRAALPAVTLALASLDGDGDIDIDLAGLTFIDIGGLRALVAASVTLSDGHVMTLHSVPELVPYLLELTGWRARSRLRLLVGGRDVPVSLR